MARSAARAWWLCVALVACGGDPDPADGAAAAGSGGSGAQSGGCGPGTAIAADGSCVEAGVAPEDCAAGFVGEDSGCRAVLPEGPCPAGTMAVPGESACRPLAPCGDTTFGDIPVEPSTQYVDGSFTGVGDGSATAPWTTIQAGVDAADAGAIVAIAAGSYPELVVLQGKRVRLWGRCPELTHIDAPSGSLAAVVIVNAGSSGAEVHDLAATGAGSAIAISAVDEVRIERVRSYDTGGVGMRFSDELGPSSATIVDSLVEGGNGLGVEIEGSALHIERTVVRDTKPVADGTFGRGINAQSSELNAVDVTIEACVVERNRDTGVLIAGGTADIEGTVVRDIAPEEATQLGGRGIVLQDDEDNGEPTHAVIRGSLIERTHNAGLFVGGAADATMEWSVIRDTLPQPDGRYGRCINVQSREEGPRATFTIRSSLVERCVQIGAVFVAADGLVESTMLRDTLADADGSFGDGVAVVADVGLPASLAVVASVIRGSARAGISSFGAPLTLERSRLECNVIPLDVEVLAADTALTDGGGNACGCDLLGECQATTSNITPPDGAAL